MSFPLVVAVVASLALALTAVLTPLVRGASLGMGLVRQAQADRWHRRPTPAIGGVAIFLGFGIALGVGYLLDPSAGSETSYAAPNALLPWTPWEGLLAAGTLVFLVGLADDLLHLNPLQKLAGQLAAAVLLVLSGIGVWLTGVYLVDAALSLLWFVAITNAMNLLDNMDGLAAGVAAIAGGYLSLLFFLEGEWGLLMLALAFTASLVGFLVHNYPPARIFMGDSGSLFLGLFLAGLSLSPTAGLSRSLFAVVMAPALVLAIPILDTALVTVGRVLEGRPVSQGGRDHTSHRLVSLGVSEERALWVLWSLALVGGAIALLLRTVERSTAYLFGAMLLVGLVLLGGYLLHVRLGALRRLGGERPPLYETLAVLHERVPFLPFVLDALLIALAYYAAYVVRWDAAELPAELAYFRQSVAVVVVVKLLVFSAAGVYSPHWQHFAMDDALGVLRASVLGTLAAAVGLFVVSRTGLSRGVLAVDLLTCTALVVGARLSFRVIEGAARVWSKDGIEVVVLGSLEDAEMAVRELRRMGEPRLRPVAVADPDVPRLRSRFGGYPLFGGRAALENALHDTGVHTVVVVQRDAGRRPGEEPEERRRERLEERVPPAVQSYLASHGALDIFELRVLLARVRHATFAGAGEARRPNVGAGD